MGRRWRWRECPSCLAVLHAGELACNTYGPNWRDGSAERQCPDCGYRGTTSEFRDVRERHPQDVARTVVTRASRSATAKINREHRARLDWDRRARLNTHTPAPNDIEISHLNPNGKRRGTRATSRARR